MVNRKPRVFLICLRFLENMTDPPNAADHFWIKIPAPLVSQASHQDIRPMPRIAYYRDLQYLHETLNFKRVDLIFMRKPLSSY